MQFLKGVACTLCGVHEGEASKLKHKRYDRASKFELQVAPYPAGPGAQI